MNTRSGVPFLKKCCHAVTFEKSFGFLMREKARTILRKSPIFPVFIRVSRLSVKCRKSADFGVFSIR
jgi:hypothetical protein